MNQFEAGYAGTEKRLVRFKDEAGRTVEQVVEVPLGSLIGQPVDETETGRMKDGANSVVADMHKEATNARYGACT
jgi:hypothetical protein